MFKQESQTLRLLPLIAITSMCAVAPAHAVEFGIFSDVTFHSSTHDEENTAFSLGQLDIFASHQIGEKTHAFIEYVFESDGGEFIVDLERISVQYNFSDHFNIAVGRFHTPLGYWNNVYHHGALLQDTVTRPSFIDFEDGVDAILPMHTVGLFADGTFELADGDLSYELAIGNGTSINTSAGAERSLETNDTSDPNNSKAVVARIGYTREDNSWGGGVFGMKNSIPESALAGGELGFGETLVEQTIYGFDFRFQRDMFDGMMEVYLINNDNKTGYEESHQARAWFAQLGMTFMPKWKAVVRYENVSSSDRDDYFILLGRVEHIHQIAALRYDVDDSSAIKLEVDQENPEDGKDETMYIVQWSFLIP